MDMFAHPRKGTNRSSTLSDREAVDATIPASTSAEPRSKFSRFAIPPPSASSSMAAPTSSRSSPKARPSSSLLASPVSKGTTAGGSAFGRVFGASSMGSPSSSSLSSSSETTSARDQLSTGGTASLIRPRPFMQASASGTVKAAASPDGLPGGIMSGFGRFKSSFFGDAGNTEASTRVEDASISASIPGARSATAVDVSSSEAGASDGDARSGTGRRKTNLTSVGTSFQTGSARSSPETNR